MQPHLRNLKSPLFELEEGGHRVLPQCECWKMRPRWTVQRVLRLWWRCVDCGEFGKRWTNGR